MRSLRTALAATVAAPLLLAAGGCLFHSHGAGGHDHNPDGSEKAWTDGPKDDPAPKDRPHTAGPATEWWGLYDGKKNIGTRRTTLRTMRGGGQELVVETDWFAGNLNNIVRVRAAQPFQADDLLVKTYSDGLVKREYAFERESDGGNIMVVRDRHNDDVRRIAVPADAMTLQQVPHYLESPKFHGATAATVTLLETEGGIATWSFTRGGTTTIRLHGNKAEAVVIEGNGDAIDGHDHATFYLVHGRVELIAYGDKPVLLLRASRGGARQDLDRHPLDH